MAPLPQNERWIMERIDDGHGIDVNAAACEKQESSGQKYIRAYCITGGSEVHAHSGYLLSSTHCAARWTNSVTFFSPSFSLMRAR